MNDLRNLLAAATNKLIEEGHVRLDNTPVQNGYIITELFGRTSAILFNDIGYDEVRISVWWDYNHDAHPQAKLSGASREEFTTSSPLAKKNVLPEIRRRGRQRLVRTEGRILLTGQGQGQAFRHLHKDDCQADPRFVTSRRAERLQSRRQVSLLNIIGF